MKRVLTVWMAAARTLWWKVLLVCAAMVGGQIALFARVLPKAADWELGALLHQSGAYLVFFLAVVVLTALLCLQGCQLSRGATAYTLRRLPMGETGVTALWAVHHLGCYGILWAAEVGTVFLLWRMYQTALGRELPLLGLLLACYSTPFFHGLLPMANAMRWIRTSVFFLTLAGSAAWFGYYQRQGLFRVQPAVILAAGLLFWNLGMQETAWDWILIVGNLILLGFMIFPWKGEHPDED